jgi:hypothetical protein
MVIARPPQPPITVYGMNCLLFWDIGTRIRSENCENPTAHVVTSHQLWVTGQAVHEKQEWQE